MEHTEADYVERIMALWDSGILTVTEIAKMADMTIQVVYTIIDSTIKLRKRDEKIQRELYDPWVKKKEPYSPWVKSRR